MVWYMARLMQTGSCLSRNSWMSPPSHYRCGDCKGGVCVCVGGGGVFVMVWHIARLMH